MPFDVMLKLNALNEAYLFLDKCKAAPAEAEATGALRDAREWIRTASKELIEEAREHLRFPITEEDMDEEDL